MVSAHDPENGPGTSGPGNSRPSLTHPQKPAGTAADQQVSRLVTPDTTEIPGRSEYRENQPGISDKSYRAKRRTRLRAPDYYDTRIGSTHISAISEPFSPSPLRVK